MACPYFMPSDNTGKRFLATSGKISTSRADGAGHCTAPAHEGETPAQDVLKHSATSDMRAAWSPPERRWDAVRFAVSAPIDKTARSDPRNATAAPGRVLFLRWVCERDHRPVEYGDLEFDLAQATWLRCHDDARIQKMAECFLESYFRKKAWRPPASRDNTYDRRYAGAVRSGDSQSGWPNRTAQRYQSRELCSADASCTGSSGRAMGRAPPYRNS